MGLTSFIGIGIGLIIITMILLILKTDKRNAKNKPYLLSLFALSFIVLHLVLWLFDFYAVIPERISDLIFEPIWILSSIIGFTASYKEFKNNRRFATLTGGLAIISSIVGVVAWGIGNI